MQQFVRAFLKRSRSKFPLQLMTSKILSVFSDFVAFQKTSTVIHRFDVSFSARLIKKCPNQKQAYLTGLNCPLLQLRIGFKPTYLPKIGGDHQSPSPHLRPCSRPLHIKFFYLFKLAGTVSLIAEILFKTCDNLIR